MVSIPLVRGFWVRPFLQFFREAGAPVERYLEQAGFLLDVDRGSDMAFPSRPLEGILYRLAAESGRCDVGFKVGERTRLLDLGPFGRPILSQETLGDAIVTARALMPSVHSARQVGLSTTGSVARLSIRLNDTQLTPTLWCDQFALSLLIDLVRMAAGGDWAPERASIQTLPARDPQPGGSLAGTTVRYSAHATSIEFPRALLGCPLGLARGRASRNPVTGDTDVDLEPLPTDFAGSLQAISDTLVSQGFSDIGHLAACVGLSVRTLQRRLSEQGGSFSELLILSRRGLAQRRLLDPNARVADVARETGYSNPTHFTRAFRGWTGLTPVGYRTANA